jgi:ligand-binding sensor domain-containing protein
MLIRCLICAILTFTAAHGFGQSYSFLSYALAEGLPQTQVTSIAEDEKGYLWVGTLGGLGRFNGVSFNNFSTEDGLLNNRITSLSSLKDKLWIGHEGGISLYYKQKFKSWKFTGENKGVRVSAIKPFQNGVVISTNGGGLYFLDARQVLKAIPLESADENRVRGLEAVDGTLYVATRGGLLKTTDLKKFKVLGVSGQLEALNVSGISRQGAYLYLTTFDLGIFRFQLDSEQFRPYGFVTAEEGPRNCMVDSRGNLWSVCTGGLLTISPGSRHKRIIDESKGLPLSTLSVIFEDRNGTIWIGSEGKGLLRFPGEQFVYFNAKNGIQSDLIISGLELTPGSYLFGSYDKGLIGYSRSKGFDERLATNNPLWAIEKDAQGNIWIGSDAGLMQLIPGGKIVRYDQTTEISVGKVTAIYKDNLGEIWVGGSDALFRIARGRLYSVKGSEIYKDPDIGTIRNIVRYKDQLICATDGGLFTFKDGKYTRFLKLSKAISSLKTDAYNNLWIGTEDGFYWSDGTALKQVHLGDQPSSNYIYFLNGNGKALYVGTNNGLYVVSGLGAKEMARSRHYGLEEGLVNLESNINSSFIDAAGRLWFGTAEGLTVFHPDVESALARQARPFLNIKSLRLNFETFKYSDYSDRLDDNEMPLQLTLPHSKNNLMIELDGVMLRNAGELRYEYWLEGLDDKWSPEFTNPQITLSNLPSGAYTLHVRARNGKGIYSGEYTLELKVTPAFYATWWFFLLILLLVIGLVIGLFQLRLKRERAKSYQEALEFKSRLQSLEQQSLNASMNRHFIFNSLNSIQYFINTQDRISANRYLTNFAKLIRKNLDSSSEEDNMVSLSEEIERLELYLSLESMRFRDRFEYKISASGIDTESVLVPAMLFQPFIENSIIHGILPDETRKGLIQVNISRKENYLEVVLEDNGVGIDYSLNKKQGANGDHRSQGMEITSKRMALLKKISHRDFEMEGPVQIEDENHRIKGTKVLLKIPCHNLEDEN